MEEHYISGAGKNLPASQTNSGDMDKSEKYLLFMSNHLLFGVPVKYTLEIINGYSFTSLPLVPSYIRGIINLRGQIIPIIDIRLMLDNGKTENSCIVTLNIDEKIIEIDPAVILPSPSKSHQGLVSGMCSLPDEQTMLLLDCAQLLRQS